MSGHCQEERGRKKLNKQTQFVPSFFFFLSQHCYFSRTIALQIEGTGWSSSEFGFQCLHFYIVFSHGKRILACMEGCLYPCVWTTLGMLHAHLWAGTQGHGVL